MSRAFKEALRYRARRVSKTGREERAKQDREEEGSHPCSG